MILKISLNSVKSYSKCKNNKKIFTDKNYRAKNKQPTQVALSLQIYWTADKNKAGFYSKSFVSNLVNSLHTIFNQIKYKIIAKKALRSDAFTEFILYVFDNFPEKKAKKMTNSFVGELRRKYI